MDSVYPEPLSLLHKRAVRKMVHKNHASRYRTQPVTFSEIQEVDEDNIEDHERTAGSVSKSELDLKAKFEEFKRQRDRDLLEFRISSRSETGDQIEQKPEGQQSLSPDWTAEQYACRKEPSRARTVPRPGNRLHLMSPSRPSI